MSKLNVPASPSVPLSSNPNPPVSATLTPEDVLEKTHVVKFSWGTGLAFSAAMTPGNVWVKALAGDFPEGVELPYDQALTQLNAMVETVKSLRRWTDIRAHQAGAVESSISIPVTTQWSEKLGMFQVFAPDFKNGEEIARDEVLAVAVTKAKYELAIMVSLARTTSKGAAGGEEGK